MPQREKTRVDLFWVDPRQKVELRLEFDSGKPPMRNHQRFEKSPFEDLLESILQQVKEIQEEYRENGVILLIRTNRKDIVEESIIPRIKRSVTVASVMSL